jgi:hypothetical protein
MEVEIKVEQLKSLPLNVILEEVWPTGLCLMRDYQWIAFWEHEDEETAYTQNNDSFEDFIYRVIANEIENGQADSEGFNHVSIDFAIAEVDYLFKKTNQ